MSTFMGMLQGKFDEGKNVCIGLDTDFREMSQEVKTFLRAEKGFAEYGAEGPVMLAFNKTIISATFDIAACYKLNPAFYAANGLQGLWALQMTAEYICHQVPNVPWILDGKYGDVGNSSKAYARYAFEVLRADAATVNPWGGRVDGIDVFLGYANKGIFVWCIGSNGGASDFQLRERSGLIAAIKTFGEWNTQKNCGVIVGATEPEAIKRVRSVVGDMPILIPGIGAQNGDLEAAVKAAGRNALFNSSRGIIYASRGTDFAEAARKEAERLHVIITAQGIVRDL